ncbi:MAG: TIGR00296 family protein, partial [Candidatus Aenigmarchaeota archaeon]|nr:TIGR00296 family protein [Candidatus Aenigmarchaeota archaeon]
NKKLIEAIMEASVSVTGDSRFPTLSENELNKVTVEVSVLTKPEKIIVRNPKEYLKEIKIGTDGLIIQNGYQYGLLLPQVPLEQKWDVKSYLEHLCMKAGMPIDAWEYGGSELLRFRSEVYAEAKPNGKIVKLGH